MSDDIKSVRVHWPTIKGKKELKVFAKLDEIAKKGSGKKKGGGGDTAHTFKPPTTEVVYDKVTGHRQMSVVTINELREYIGQFDGKVHVVRK